jgi:acetolactate synthase-1/2/3 large subunit
LTDIKASANAEKQPLQNIQKLTTGQAVAKSLMAQGVDTVFGIPGIHIYNFIDAIAQEPINFVLTRHEQGAAYMAFGYAKSTGKTGVYTVVPGPGMLNSSAALCTAYGANTPLLCITGNIMSHLIGKGRGQLHELPDQLTTMRGFTGWAERIEHATQAPQLVAEAFRQMYQGRIRPAVLESPWDTFGESADVNLEVDRSIPVPPTPDRDSIAAAAELIRNAKNPLIIVGAGAYGASKEIEDLAKLLQAPVTAHRSGKGVVSNDSPYGLLSTAARIYWPKCDLLIGIGSRLELAYFRWNWQPEGLKTVRIDIDPTEFVRLPTDMGIVTDAALGTQALIDVLQPLVGERSDRRQEFEKYKQAAEESFNELTPQIGYLRAIRRALPRDGFFVEEITQMGFVARFAFPVYEPRQYVTCGYQDNLGFGFHTALGVKVGNPDKAVVAVCGDGGFMFGVQELATAVQQQINLVTIIFNNSAFGNVRRDQLEQFDGRLLGADLVNPDFVALANSFGAKGLEVESPEQLEVAISKGFREKGPVVIVVTFERGSESSPWPFVHPAPPNSE